MTFVERALAALGALMALAGVALSAYAAHAAGGDLLKTAAMFLLIHGVAVFGACGFGWAGKMGVLRLGAFVLFLGTALFAADLGVRALLAQSLFPYAAPTGGIAMMAGWALMALGLLIG